MCETQCDGQAELRFHLHTRHAKSEFVEHLVADDVAGAAEVGAHA